jgi:hypothetical protein
MGRPKKKTIADMTDEEILVALSNFIDLPPVNRIIFTHDKRFLKIKFT